MENGKTIYGECLRKLLRNSYLVLKESKVFPKEKETYIQGFMEAGRILGVQFGELKEIIDEEHFRVFGMSVEERKKTYKATATFDETYYDIPTWLREGKKLEI